MVQEMIRLCWGSVADCAIVPLQDVLDLPTRSRMNLPGTGQGNWKWRAGEEDVRLDRFERLAALTETFGRNPSAAAQ